MPLDWEKVILAWFDCKSLMGCLSSYDGCLSSYDGNYLLHTYNYRRLQDRIAG